MFVLSPISLITIGAAVELVYEHDTLRYVSSVEESKVSATDVPDGVKRLVGTL
jgi:hypothetical protein